MYNYYPTQPGRQQPSFGLKGRPVSSLEEVRATSIDFDGSVFYFPDLANKRIYTKQINMDGTASLNMYELKPVPKETVNDYITRAEFEEAIKQLAATGSMRMVLAAMRPVEPTAPHITLSALTPWNYVIDVRDAVL